MEGEPGLHQQMPSADAALDSLGKRERWVCRTGERGCWGRGWHHVWAPFPSNNSQMLPGVELHALKQRVRLSPPARVCRKARAAGESPPPPPAPRSAASLAASHPTWPRTAGRAPSRRPPRQSRGSPPFQKWPVGLRAAPAGGGRPGGGC